MADTIAEQVVQAAQGAYAALPKHGKPIVRDNGVAEWTILAAIVLVRPDREPHLVSLGTGVKVLPAARLPPLGDTVHDCHAEVLARRGFLRWLVAEAVRVQRGEASEWLVWREDKFGLAPGVEVFLYVSALPCGDASTLHTAAHQPADAAEAFKNEAARRAASEQDTPPVPTEVVRGRNGYENYGAIRTKPGRPDSPPSISFSCSDKIATWTVLGLQGALLARLFEPVYLDHIVIGGVEVPEGQREDEWHATVVAEAERALWRRVEGIGALPPPYRLTQPRLHLTPRRFALSREAALASGASDPSTSTVSLSHVPVLGKPEVIINGCAQGSGWKAPGKVLLKDKQRSRVCKMEVLRAFVGLSAEAELADETYFSLKHANTAYQEAKAALRGVPAERLNADWAKRLPHEFEVTSAASGATAPPFTGWIPTGPRYESFTSRGVLAAL
ncbi:tRNA-specific adenosine deaminase TAD1 [Vanrija pseudolonga]|uniref:tRNA-specific adenosine deaminase TAD1 n=1 Tax=Vanrija pseudolonga TaxID=143232 RepID=A0AAF0YCV9_9TREE|nr:tRNA-specific adenosine deaminase TAD1 [Vanrija pseudolonga]